MNYSIFNYKKENITPHETSNQICQPYLGMDCIDVGSEQCPCYLAITGDCLTCTRLQGKDYCDCNWKGVCIYNEFIQGGGRVNNPRKEFEADIVQKKLYKDDLVTYILRVGKGFDIKASIPGTFIFIKSGSASSFYDIPISVMDVDVEKGLIHIAVKIISAKTKLLLKEDNKLTVRGPYRNGILGISAILKKPKPGQSNLIIAKGIGIAPGILASKYLTTKSRVDFVIDPEKISKELSSDYLNEGCEDRRTDNNTSADSVIKYLSLSENTAQNELENLMIKKQYDCVLILTSDYYIQSIGALVKRILPEADIAVMNNFRICCGGGVCGSCSHETQDGETLKMCKCQVSGKDVL